MVLLPLGAAYVRVRVQMGPVLTPPSPSFQMSLRCAFANGMGCFITHQACGQDRRLRTMLHIVHVCIERAQESTELDILYEQLLPMLVP